MKRIAPWARTFVIARAAFPAVAASSESLYRNAAGRGSRLAAAQLERLGK